MPSELNLIRSAPLPFLAISSPAQTLPSRPTYSPCGIANMPAPMAFTNLPDEIEFQEWRKHRIGAFTRRATVKDPDALTGKYRRSFQNNYPGGKPTRWVTLSQS